MTGFLIGIGIFGLILMLIALAVLMERYLYEQGLYEQRKVLVDIIFTLIGIIALIFVITMMLYLWR